MKFKFCLLTSIAILFAYVLVIYISPLPYAVIDSDKSGLISIGELLNSIDIGQRQQTKAPKDCIEYFWLKDGLPAYETCQSSAGIK